VVRPRTIECADCGIQHFWCDVCQRAICGHLVAVADALSERKPRSVTSSLEPLRAFVTWVLAEISVEAQLLELMETPGEKYTLRIEIQREVPKPLVIAKCLIDSAVTHSGSLRTFRNILRTYVLGMVNTRLRSDVRETLAGRFPPAHDGPEAEGLGRQPQNITDIRCAEHLS